MRTRVRLAARGSFAAAAPYADSRAELATEELAAHGNSCGNSRADSRGNSCYVLHACVC